MTRKTLGIFTIFLCLLFSTTKSYANKVVLLTSLDPQENRPPLRLSSWNINEKLAERFYKEHRKFLVKATTKVIHYATAQDLYENLIDPEVSAIVWVGHAGFADSEGMSSLRSIVDYRGRDLKSVFQAIGPHTKFLGLVGCRGQHFLNEWQELGYLDHLPHLKTFGRAVRTDARKGLRLAMKALRTELKKNPNLFNHKTEMQEHSGEAYQDPRNTRSITITRRNLSASSMSSVQILQKDRLIGFLPASDGDQTATIRINSSTESSQLKVISDSGASSREKEINLGILEIESPFHEEWKLFATPTGKPIGIGKNIYRHKFLSNKEKENK